MGANCMTVVCLPFALALSLALSLAAAGCKKTVEPLDADGDGFDSDVDCNDADAAINPDAVEVCDAVDNNCDGAVDDADSALDLSTATTFYTDADTDGYGDLAAPVQACLQPAGAVTTSTDCDDTAAAVHPGAGEVCNDIDDDCDGTVDVEASDALTWHLDADGDSFGDPAQTIVACSVPKGYVADGSDCDDARADVSPDGVETCNGLDDDCDPATTEDGMATWLADAGTVADWTDHFDGTAGAPATLSLDQPGSLVLCDGTFYAKLQVAADVTLRSQGGDASAVLLDAGGSGSAIALSGDGLSLTVADLTVVGGDGEYNADLYAQGGGGLLCTGASSLRLDHVVLTGGTAFYGANLATVGCDTDLADSVIEGGYASIGAGALMIDGAHTWQRVVVRDNQADYTAGGLYVGSWLTTSVPVDLDEVWLDANDSGSYAPAAWLGGVDLLWTGSAKTTSGATGSTTTTGEGPALMFSSGSFVFDVVDFGTSAGGDDNVVPELRTAGGHDYVADDDRSFTCGDTVCGTGTTWSLGGSDSSESVAGYVLGDVVQADEWGTIEAFAMDFTVSGSCTSHPYVASSTDPAGGTWTRLWSGSSATMAASGSVSADSVGVLAEPGLYYALLIGVTCGAGSYPNVLETFGTGSTEAGLGTATGYVFATYAGSWDDTAVFNYIGGGWVPFSQRMEETRLLLSMPGLR